jgi:membrane-associated phospholipid phosphatase
MSFLIDPPWLYANGRAYARLAPERARQGRIAAAAGAATIATFWAVSISLYLNRSWTDPIARACSAETGRDWMLNSGVLKLDHRRAGPLTHAIGAALFATYPLWLWLGWRDGRRRG